MSVVALVADDHALFRRAVAALLREECGVHDVMEVASFDETMAYLEERKDASLAVLDLFMPGLNSALRLRGLRERFPQVRIVILTGSLNRQDILDALAAGVHGFVRKTASLEEIRSAIIQVLDGKIYLPPETSMYEQDRSDTGIGIDGNLLGRLTPRQLEMVHHLRAGSSNKQIARALGLAENTVKVHVNAVYRALGIRDRRQIANVAAHVGESET